MIAQAELVVPELVEDLELIAPPTEGGGYWIWVLAAVLAGLAVAVPLFLVFRRHDAIRTKASADQPRPDPAVLARERLAVLRSESPRLSPKRAAMELSMILRDYIIGRFEIRAPFQTTREFLDAVGQSAPFPSTQKDDTVELLQRLDRIKFAASNINESEFEDLISSVEQFVVSTAASESEPAEGGSEHA